MSREGTPNDSGERLKLPKGVARSRWALLGGHSIAVTTVTGFPVKSYFPLWSSVQLQVRYIHKGTFF